MSARRQAFQILLRVHSKRISIRVRTIISLIWRCKTSVIKILPASSVVASPVLSVPLLTVSLSSVVIWDFLVQNFVRFIIHHSRCDASILSMYFIAIPHCNTTRTTKLELFLISCPPRRSYIVSQLCQVMMKIDLLSVGWCQRIRRKIKDRPVRLSSAASRLHSPVAVSRRRHQDASLNLFHRALAGSVTRRILAARQTRRVALRCPARYWRFA